jgi:hypothetical protein
MSLRACFMAHMPYQRCLVYRQIRVVFRWYKANFEIALDNYNNVEVWTSRFNRTTLTYEYKHIHTDAWRY